MLDAFDWIDGCVEGDGLAVDQMGPILMWCVDMRIGTLLSWCVGVAYRFQPTDRRLAVDGEDGSVVRRWVRACLPSIHSSSSPLLHPLAVGCVTSSAHRGRRCSARLVVVACLTLSVHRSAVDLLVCLTRISPLEDNPAACWMCGGVTARCHCWKKSTPVAMVVGLGKKVEHHNFGASMVD
ncbi:hypothetical protein ACLOJK_018792 [Asimina triloba]